MRDPDPTGPASKCLLWVVSGENGDLDHLAFPARNGGVSGVS